MLKCRSPGYNWKTDQGGTIWVCLLCIQWFSISQSTHEVVSPGYKFKKDRFCTVWMCFVVYSVQTRNADPGHKWKTKTRVVQSGCVLLCIQWCTSSQCSQEVVGPGYKFKKDRCCTVLMFFVVYSVLTRSCWSGLQLEDRRG